MSSMNRRSQRVSLSKDNCLERSGGSIRSKDGGCWPCQMERTGWGPSSFSFASADAENGKFPWLAFTVSLELLIWKWGFAQSASPFSWALFYVYSFQQRGCSEMVSWGVLSSITLGAFLLFKLVSLSFFPFSLYIAVQSFCWFHFVLFWATPGYAQGLLLALHTGITSGGAQVTICSTRNWTLVDHGAGKRPTHGTLQSAFKSCKKGTTLSSFELIFRGMC